MSSPLVGVDATDVDRRSWQCYPHCIDCCGTRYVVCCVVPHSVVVVVGPVQAQVQVQMQILGQLAVGALAVVKCYYRR